MANGLNARFKLDPVAFLSSYWDINSSQPQHGEGYGIDGDGIAQLDLVAYSPETVRVARAETGFFASIGKEAPIKAYYLASEVDKTKSLSLRSKADYFFTDAITGCQFMAYGNDRHNITTCHVNALNNGGMTVYNAEAKGIREANFPITIIYGQPHYQAGLNQGEDKGNVVVTVIGWRRADGWHFYTRRRLNDPNHRRVLDGRAYEL
jgi:hypothetical protein